VSEPRVGSALARAIAFGALIAASCSPMSEDTTPGSSSGPAFSVLHTRQEACAPNVCIKARIKNYGRQGQGSCELWGVVEGSSQGIEGPTVALPLVDSGDVIVQTIEWVGDVPSGGFSVDCSPTLQS